MLEPVVNFFISNAYAETAGVPQQTSSFSFVIMLLVFFVFIYFAIWRPQNKRAKEQQNLLNSLAKGDEVITAGGILGRISKLADRYVMLAIANEVEIIVQKSTIVGILPKGTIKSIE